MFYDSVSLYQVKLKYRLSSYVIIMMMIIIIVIIVKIIKIIKNNVQTGNTKMVVFF